MQGLSATILRNTPANAVYLGNFEMMKRAYCNQYNITPDKVPGWVVLCAAGMRVLCACMCAPVVIWQHQ
jgi:solute carrier family 25 carnitine/acylcarnitine transporter 20/29